jgi:hypothetical protein
MLPAPPRPEERCNNEAQRYEFSIVEGMTGVLTTSAWDSANRFARTSRSYASEAARFALRLTERTAVGGEFAVL